MTTIQKELPAGWKWAKLGDVCESERKAIRPDDPVAKTLPYLALEDIETQTGRILVNPGAKLDEGIRSNTFAFNSQHILYGKLRPYLNKVSAPVFSGRCSTELIPLLPTCALKDYLLWYLRRPESVDFAMQTAFGSRMPRTNMATFMELPIPLPPLEEQKRIAGILNKAEEIKKLREEADKKTEELIPAIFHQMVGSRIKKGEDIPAGWSIVPFGSIVEFRNGVSFGKENFGYGMKVIGVKNFKDYSTPQYEDLEEINPEGIIHEQDMLADQDLIFVRSNGNRELIGRSLYITNLSEPIIHSGFTIRARFKSPDALPRFFAHVMKSPLVRSHLSTYGGGGTNISNLNQRVLGTLPVPMLPIKQQQVIAERLNEAEEIKKTNAESAKKIEELKSSLLQRAFRGEL